MRLLGLVLILVGLGVLTLARIQFEKESSKQSGLVTRGVYSRIRHPIYLFSSIAFVGLLLYLNELRGILLLLPIQLVLSAPRSPRGTTTRGALWRPISSVPAANLVLNCGAGSGRTIAA